MLALTFGKSTFPLQHETQEASYLDDAVKRAVALPPPSVFVLLLLLLLPPPFFVLLLLLLPPASFFVPPLLLLLLLQPFSVLLLPDEPFLLLLVFFRPFLLLLELIVVLPPPWEPLLFLLGQQAFLPFSSSCRSLYTHVSGRCGRSLERVLHDRASRPGIDSRDLIAHIDAVVRHITGTLEHEYGRGLVDLGLCLRHLYPF